MFLRLLLLNAVVVLLAACKPAPAELSASYPIEPTEASIAEGKPLYNAFCSTCHASPETGGTRRFNAPPHDESGHTWHHADRLLVDWVLNGVPSSTVMPAFGNQLSEEQVIAIVAYIKSTWNPEVQEFQRQASQAWEDQLERE